jgi:hypothetical protein
VVTSAVIGQRRPKTVTERLTACLLFIGRDIQRLDQGTGIGGRDLVTTEWMMAETESEDFDEFFRLVKMLGETGLIEDQLSMTAQEWFFNTPRAWSEVERLLTTQTDSNQAFVAMWFNDSVEEAFTKGIAPAIAHSGYRPLRIDQKEHNNKIDDEIIAEIRRLRFVIADFTCAPGSPRGGVYYEAGFARGLGMPVIWTCKNESMSDLHFDTRQYAHIVWGAPDDLYRKLKARIGATLGDGPLPKA